MSSFEIYQNIQLKNKLNKVQQAQQQDKLERDLNRNNHTLIALTSNEYLNLISSIQKSKGYTPQQTLDWIDNIVNTAAGVTAATKKRWSTFKASWSEHSASGKTLASFWPVVDDSRLLGALALELKRGGNVLSKYKVVTYPRQTFVVLYSDPALSKHLTRNIFIASNPQIVNMGIGKLGAAKAIKSGVIFTVVFSIGFHALDQLMQDQLTWHHFVGGVAVDVILAAAASGIAWGFVASIVGGSAMVAVGPMLIVVAVGVGLTVTFNSLSSEYRLVDKVAALLIEAEQRNAEEFAAIQRNMKRSLTYAKEDPHGFMHRLFGIPYFKDKSSHISAARGR
jgi:hypothetical protein